jgi:hypothetical protein
MITKTTTDAMPIMAANTRLVTPSFNASGPRKDNVFPSSLRLVRPSSPLVRPSNLPSRNNLTPRIFYATRDALCSTSVSRLTPVVSEDLRLMREGTGYLRKPHGRSGGHAAKANPRLPLYGALAVAEVTSSRGKVT